MMHGEALVISNILKDYVISNCLSNRYHRYLVQKVVVIESILLVSPITVNKGEFRS